MHIVIFIHYICLQRIGESYWTCAGSDCVLFHSPNSSEMSYWALLRPTHPWAFSSRTFFSKVFRDGLPTQAMGPLQTGYLNYGQYFVLTIIELIGWKCYQQNFAYQSKLFPSNYIFLCCWIFLSIQFLYLFLNYE